MAEIEEAHILIRDSWFRYGQGFDKCTSSSSSIGEDSSMESNGSSSDTTDDASSSPSAPSSLTESDGTLCDFSEVMKQLPIKKGLSKFYEGKSDSFASLARVSSIEDLAKKATPYRRSLKASKSCGYGLNTYKPYTLHKAIITKKSGKNSSCYTPFSTKRGSSLHQKLEC